MGIVWHGHYTSYFEDARRAFGARYGIDYSEIRQHALRAPIVHLGIDFMSPAFDNDLLEVTARLLKTDAAKLELQYEIVRPADHQVLARGESVQVFTDSTGKLLLRPPPLLTDCYKRWEASWK